VLTASKNFPYATIEPEEARVIVPDDRFTWLCDKYKPKSVVPANLTVYDIAGLTRGSSTGAGLGNSFLSHIRAVDAIFQVVRCFDDAEIIHIEGDVNPTRDLDIISEELRLKDIEFVEKALENQKKKTRMGGQSLELKKAKLEQETIEKILAWLQDGKDIRKGDWGPKEVRSFSAYVAARFLCSLFRDDKRPIGLNLIPARRMPHLNNARVHTEINLTLTQYPTSLLVSFSHSVGLSCN
jgi:GTP-binding protein YchF